MARGHLEKFEENGSVHPDAPVTQVSEHMHLQAHINDHLKPTSTTTL